MTPFNAKLLLSALGLALIATPAVAAPNDQAASSYRPSANTVIVEGKVVGADPDARIRSALTREWDSLHGE